MILTKGQPAWKIVIVFLACLVLVAGLLGWRYCEQRQSVRLKFTQAIPPVPIPANASPEMREFLQNQTTLAQKMEQMRSQGPNGTLSPQAFIQFRQQNAALLKRQSDLAQVIARQQAKNTVSAPSTQIPPNASPQMQTYLQLRDQIMRDQIAFMNQHRTDDLTTRLADMQQWRQQNASRLQQLQELMQALAHTTSK